MFSIIRPFLLNGNAGIFHSIDIVNIEFQECALVSLIRHIGERAHNFRHTDVCSGFLGISIAVVHLMRPTVGIAPVHIFRCNVCLFIVPYISVSIGESVFNLILVFCDIEQSGRYRIVVDQTGAAGSHGNVFGMEQLVPAVIH